MGPERNQTDDRFTHVGAVIAVRVTEHDHRAIDRGEHFVSSECDTRNGCQTVGEYNRPVGNSICVVIFQDENLAEEMKVAFPIQVGYKDTTVWMNSHSRRIADAEQAVGVRRFRKVCTPDGSRLFHSLQNIGAVTTQENKEQQQTGDSEHECHLSLWPIRAPRAAVGILKQA